MKKIYRHYKTNSLYEFVNSCKMQENDKWVEAIIYKSIDSDNLYVRKTLDFLGKFILIDKKIYQVKLENKDKNIYTLFIEANDFLDVPTKALKIIKDLNWEKFEYKVIEIININ